MYHCTRVILVDYRMDDMCATVQELHVATALYTRALPTRGHARLRVQRAGRQIRNLRAWAGLYTTKFTTPQSFSGKRLIFGMLLALGFIRIRRRFALPNNTEKNLGWHRSIPLFVNGSS